MVDRDYYELLGVAARRRRAAIKAAYRRLAKECHPDRHGGCTDKEAHFKAISEAYDVLKDPQKRAAYDRFGNAAFQNGGGGGDPFGAGGGFEGFSDIFSSIFGEFMDPRAQRQNAARGADLRYDLELTLEEAFAGAEKDDHDRGVGALRGCDGRGSRGEAAPRSCATCNGAGKVRAQQGFFVVERGCPSCLGSGETIADPCAACDGEGRALEAPQIDVDIPAGVDEGTRIRVSGEGEAGIRSAASGDLYIFVHMKRHSIFERDGTTLVAECPVSFTTAALGGSITLPGRRWRTRSRSRFPPASSRARQLRHRGAGMSILNGRGRGDLVARILVETPTQAVGQAEGSAPGVPRDRNRRRMPGDQASSSAIRDKLGA